MKDPGSTVNLVTATYDAAFSAVVAAIADPAMHAEATRIRTQHVIQGCNAGVFLFILNLAIGLTLFFVIVLVNSDIPVHWGREGR